MPVNIKPITLALPLKLGTVNCYLVTTDTGFLLIDTASSNQRGRLEAELANAGCQPGDLKLIILTHGDFDHTGNAVYLHEKWRAPLAMHAADAGMLERGDMFWNRKKGNAVLRKIAPALFGFGQAQRGKPDLTLADGDTLSTYGWDAQALHLPGHSSGSIGVLTSTGDLYCGDLLDNTKQPAFNSIMDDLSSAQATVEHLKTLNIQTVYPGHGQPFAWTDFVKAQA